MITEMICVTTSVALYFHLAALLRTEIKVKLATCAFVDEIDTAFKFNNKNYGYKGWDSYKATFPYNTFFFFTIKFIYIFTKFELMFIYLIGRLVYSIIWAHIHIPRSSLHIKFTHRLTEICHYA